MKNVPATFIALAALLSTSSTETVLARDEKYDPVKVIRDRDSSKEQRIEALSKTDNLAVIGQLARGLDGKDEDEASRALAKMGPDAVASALALMDKKRGGPVLLHAMADAQGKKFIAGLEAFVHKK